MRGVKLGRKPKLTEHQKREAIRRRDIAGEPVREIARGYNVSHSTISRLTIRLCGLCGELGVDAKHKI
ncbi:MAG: helix-turn-helix domain-containing protein [Stellaceae bacterium]